MDRLTDPQMEHLLAQGQALEEAERLLPETQRQALVRLQQQAADAYAAGTWEIQGSGEPYVVPENPSPTVEETRHILGETASHLPEGAEKQGVIVLMQSMGLIRTVKATDAVSASR